MFLTYIALLFSCTAMMAFGDQLQKTDLPSPEDLQKAAIETSNIYSKAVKKSSATNSNYIPEKCWTEEIKSLKPIRVYMHGANTVIVLQETAVSESGIYVYNLLSSHIPIDGDNESTFYTIGQDIYGYSRERKGSEGI